MTNTKVKSLETYLEQLPRLSEKMTDEIFYRGQSNTSYKLTPSVLRDDIKNNEHTIYTQIMTECAHEFADCDSHNEILSKMQHYGVPTRLLDVTTNALVALYFACGGNQDKDGVVYVIRTDKSQIKSYDSDAISILAALPRFSYAEKVEIAKFANEIKSQNQGIPYDEQLISNFNEKKIIKRLLHEIKKEKSAFDNIINPDDILKNFFFLPRKSNARIIRQSGAFIIFGLHDNEIIIDNHFSDTNVNYGNSYKIIIDQSYKQEIIKQLACFGISKATLHPELYKVAEFINEKYKTT